MATSVFYSWQSDLFNSTNRSFVRKALDIAVKAVNDELVVHDAQRDEVVVDQDTQGVSGSPTIADVILRKIRECAVFVPDYTIIGRTVFDDNLRTKLLAADESLKMPETRLVPNPNVMLEYGYALRAIGDEAIVPVFNEAFGEWGELPFDLRHKKRPITYRLLPTDDSDTKSRVRKGLVKALTSAIRAVLDCKPKQEDDPQVIFERTLHAEDAIVSDYIQDLTLDPNVAYRRCELS